MEEVNFEIEDREIKRDIGLITQELNDIIIQLEKMFESMNQLNRMWKGPSNTAFKEEVKKDYTNMVEICRMLEGYVDCMDYSCKEYVRAESQIEELIDSIE